MTRVAIIGAGPTGIYTLQALLGQATARSIVIFEQAEQAGVGMPYNHEDASRLMLANIASIEIPPIKVTYLEWLRAQPVDDLARFGVDHASLHERQFLPRILLGHYFRDQFLALLQQATEQGVEVTVYESCAVTDIEATEAGVRVWVESNASSDLFGLVVIATGHVWPDDAEAIRHYFPSPWSGLLEASIPACAVGILGTSLSALDATMAVVAQHGRFITRADGQLRFERAPASQALQITLMSRTGLLPEADFYCPIPYQPLQIVTEPAIQGEIGLGPEGLLDRVFHLVAAQLQAADPDWSQRIALPSLDAGSFAAAYFRDRKQYDPFVWAEFNLAEVERNKRERRTVPWRYALLRMHEVVQDIVPHLDTQDRERFSQGLAKVFMDNYAAIPPESIRRLLALHAAGIIEMRELGHDYQLEVQAHATVIQSEAYRQRFEVFIDARGQRPLQTRDLPFPRLRQQLLVLGEALPELGDDYTLSMPEAVRGKIALAALPYLMHDQPFVQGITACADIGAAIARAAIGPPANKRRWLTWSAW